MQDHSVSPDRIQKEPSAALEFEPALDGDQIAIVGIGCRYPGGVRDADSFWKLLRDGIDAVTEVPKSRFDAEALYDPEPAVPGKIHNRRGGFLDNIEQFDAEFFSIAPREADRLDPQQRLLLEVAWEAMEDAGQVPNTEKARETGAFIGIWTQDYEARLTQDLAKADFHMTVGSGRYSAAGRLSYALGFQGPSLTVDTACSSSLVAIHLACQSLRNQECNLALAGGVNVILQPYITIAYSQSNMMAPDGLCKFGDSRADGYVRSEGVGIVTLKRLADALADGDQVYALIMGSAVNNDGRTSGFLTTPGGTGQEDVLRKAYAAAGISPGSVQYVEAHGTGTRAGDPVEIKALGAVLNEGRPAGQVCWTGSVKTNLGHTEGAAGVAGVIKVALALKHKMLPASLHCIEPAPTIPWEQLPIRIQTKLTAWPAPWPGYEGPALAGVSAFGIAGTNAHVVLQEAPAQPENPPKIAADASQERPHILPLSARSPKALRAMAGAYGKLLTSETGVSVYDLCYTASIRRSHHDYRLAFVASALPELKELLADFGQDESVAELEPTDGVERKILFVFPGQGSQWVGMGRQLLAQEAVFRDLMERCDQAFRPYISWSLIQEIQAPAESSRFEEIDVIQPVLFAMQVSLAALWRSWGVEPSAVIGHSMGEIAAAYCAGVLSLEDAARVICLRSKLMKRVSGKGAMIVTGLTMAEAEQILTDYQGLVSIAVNNGPRSTVLAGDPSALDTIAEILRDKDVFCRPVKVDVAAHSPHMEALKPLLQEALTDLKPAAGTIAVYSTVSGELQRGESFDGEYWGRNLRQPVRFASTLQTALAQGINTVIEISPHPVLLSAVEQGFAVCPGKDSSKLAALSSERRETDERGAMLSSLGELYTLGYGVDWNKLHPDGGRCVALPTYPWQRERYWLDNIPGMIDSEQKRSSPRGPHEHPLLGWRVELADNEGKVIWQNELDPAEHRWLYQHQLRGTTVLPASAYLEMATAAAHAVLGNPPFSLREVVFRQPLILQDDQPAVIVQTSLTPSEAGFGFRIASHSEYGWLLHVEGQIGYPESEQVSQHRKTLEKPKVCSGAISLHREEVYSRLTERGIVFGASLQPVEQAWLCGNNTWAKLPDNEKELTPRLFLDAGFHVSALAVLAGQPDQSQPFLPASITELRIETINVGQLWHCMLSGDLTNDNQVCQNLTLVDAQNAVVAEIQGLRLLRLGHSARSNPSDLLYELQWQPETLPTESSDAPEFQGNWVIFVDKYADKYADNHWVGTALAEQIRAKGGSVTMVFPGEQFVDLGQETYRIKPTSKADVTRLFQTIVNSEARDYRGIIHLWSLEAPTSTLDDAKTLLQHQQIGMGSALHVLQVASEIKWATMPKVWLITQGVHSSTNEAREASLTQSALWGLGRVASVEHPDIWGGLIDIDPTLPKEETATRLWAEIGATNSEDQIAIIGGKRHVARLRRLDHKAEPERSFRCHADASYLFTGGLGNLGLVVAKWLIERGARRLILMGRTGLPARSEWLSLDPESSTGQRVAAIRSLENMGASITLAQVDVSDEQQLVAFLETYRREGWPAIRGVVHAAGTTKDSLISRMAWDDLEEVLRAKVAGSWLLHQHLDDLDFFVLFSSIGSLIGQSGQGSYAAANAFLDALALCRRQNGLKGLSINWGSWSGMGMATSAGGKVVTQALAEQGIGTITPLMAENVMGYLFDHTTSAQVAVLPLDLDHLQSNQGNQGMPRLLATLDMLQHQVQHQKRDGKTASNQPEKTPLRPRQTWMALEAEQRRRVMEDYLRQQIAQVLRMAPGRIPLAKPVGTLGMDSLMALELRKRLERDLELPLSATFVWNYPTINELVPYLASRMELPLENATANLPVEPSAKGDVFGETSVDDLLADIENLSEETALRSLRDKQRDNQQRGDWS